MTTRRLTPLLAAVALAVVFFARQPALAQPLDDCGPIRGTIPVADGAPDGATLARVTPDQARETALAAVTGATVRDVDLEEEDGFLVYEVELVLDGHEHDVYVDAGSGEVLCTDRDD